MGEEYTSVELQARIARLRFEGMPELLAKALCGIIGPHQPRNPLRARAFTAKRKPGWDRD